MLFQGVEGVLQAAATARGEYVNGDEGGEGEAVGRPDVGAVRAHAQKFTEAGEGHIRFPVGGGCGVQESDCRRRG